MLIGSLASGPGRKQNISRKSTTVYLCNTKRFLSVSALPTEIKYMAANDALWLKSLMSSTNIDKTNK